MSVAVRHHVLRHLVCTRALVAVLICTAALFFMAQQLASESGSVLSRLQSSHEVFSRCISDVSASDYRQALGVIRPLDIAPHSKTLGVASRIYVVNLPQRTDRREVMAGLERAMDLEFTWHNATDYHSKDVQDIMERIRWWRNVNRVNASLPKADPSPFKFKWADDVNESGSLGLSGADMWSDSFGKSPLPPLPLPPSPDKRPPILDTKLENGDSFGTQTMLPAQMSCWHSHYQVLRNIAEGEDEVAIVFEDDIDMEWDLERRLRGMWGALPEDWDMVMIGYCHGAEWTNPALKGAPTLHPAHHTLCTHAYAVKRRSAQHIVRRLRSESFAYSRNIDHAIQYLSASHKLKVFSVDPPIVVQTYETESDISPGRSKERVQWLADGVRERIDLAAREEAAFKASVALDPLGEI